MGCNTGCCFVNPTSDNPPTSPSGAATPFVFRPQPKDGLPFRGTRRPASPAVVAQPVLAAVEQRPRLAGASPLHEGDPGDPGAPAFGAAEVRPVPAAVKEFLWQRPQPSGIHQDVGDKEVLWQRPQPSKSVRSAIAKATSTFTNADKYRLLYPSAPSGCIGAPVGYHTSGSVMPSALGVLGYTQEQWDSFDASGQAAAVRAYNLTSDDQLPGFNPDGTPVGSAPPPGSTPSPGGSTSNPRAPTLVPQELASRLTQQQWASLPADERAAMYADVQAGRMAAAEAAADAARLRTLQAVGSGLNAAANQVRQFVDALNQHALDVRREDHSAEAAARSHELAMYAAETARVLGQARITAGQDPAMQAQLDAMRQQVADANARVPPGGPVDTDALVARVIAASQQQQKGGNGTIIAVVAVGAAAVAAAWFLSRPRNNPGRRSARAERRACRP